MKTRTNRKKSKKANELFLFSDTEMAGGRTIRKRRSDDLEQFTDAVVEVLQILERLDKPTINRIAEECYYNSLDHGIFNKKVIFLRSLPGYFFDIIQYSVLEFCVQQVATPFYRWDTFMPEEHYEKGMQLYKQLCNDTKKE